MEIVQYVFESVLVCLLMLICWGLPLRATLLNMVRVILPSFFKRKGEKTKRLLWVADIYTLLGGAVLSLLVYSVLCTKDWNLAIDTIETPYHLALSSEYLPTFSILAIFSIVALILMRMNKKLSPIVTIVMYSFVYIGIILSVAWMLQLSKNFGHSSFSSFILGEVFYLSIYPLNYILLSITFLKDSIESVSSQNDSKIGKFVFKAHNSWVWGFAFIAPLYGVLVMILALFGQKPDSVIKVFTETADWTFSTKIPPPPLEHNGHYLCTVAAQGHKNVVKPLRYGIRNGNRIIVNRQLLIANAFEELIAERLPKIHKFVRINYDKYGYPISRHITHPWSADLVYVIMKPLEWLFLLALYTFDIKPENRIQRQYLI